jgi:hypothetical protein
MKCTGNILGGVGATTVTRCGSGYKLDVQLESKVNFKKFKRAQQLTVKVPVLIFLLPYKKK